MRKVILAFTALGLVVVITSWPRLQPGSDPGSEHSLSPAEREFVQTFGVLPHSTGSDDTVLQQIYDAWIQTEKDIHQAQPDPTPYAIHLRVKKFNRMYALAEQFGIDPRQCLKFDPVLRAAEAAIKRADAAIIALDNNPQR